MPGVALYQPAMAEVRRSDRSFVILDTLHRETLERVLADHGVDVARVRADLLHDWMLAWHRLDPWPDVVSALQRLRRDLPLVTLSNGNIASMLDLARFGGLAWDAILGAEVTRGYKPAADAYLGMARILGIAPHELCLVAAHHADLAAARGCGLLTAYVDRPLERGGAPVPDAALCEDREWSAPDLGALAPMVCSDRLG